MLSIVVSGRPHLFWRIQQCQLLRGRTAERCHTSEGCDLFNCMIKIYQDRFLQHVLLKHFWKNHSSLYQWINIIWYWYMNWNLHTFSTRIPKGRPTKVMLSSMLGNSEGQWRLLHLRQAEKVRAVIGSKLKIPKCSNDVCFLIVFFWKNGMYDDL